MQGYLEPATFEISAKRLGDTRQPGKPPIPAGSRVGVTGKENGLAVLSIIATQTVAAGYVQVLGCGQSAGAYSNLNVDRAGQTIANLAVTRLDGAGRTCMFTQGGAHLIADLQGYFDPSIYTADNRRLLDTRQR